MIQYVPGKIDLAGILIDILSKNVIIKLSDTVDALYLVFLQLRKTRIEIITFWLIKKCYVGHNGCFIARFCQRFRRTRIEIIIFLLMQKRMEGRLFSLSFCLLSRHCMRHRLHLQALPNLLPEACRIHHPGSGRSWRQTWTGTTRSYSFF